MSGEMLTIRLLRAAALLRGTVADCLANPVASQAQHRQTPTVDRFAILAPLAEENDSYP
jgi:hypothetical protein